MAAQQNSDNQLIEKIGQNDQTAFRKLFDKYYRLLLGVAINFLKDINAAKDIVQEVFFQIWKKRETLQISNSVEAYLKRAVINRALNHLKYQKRLTGDEGLEIEREKEASALEKLQADDLKEVLQKALDSLPERCRLVFVMRRMEGLSHKEIAEKLEISPKTIENQMTKALRVLKDAVQQYENKNN